MARHAPPTQSLDWQIRLGSPGGVARAALGSLRFMNSTQWLIWALIAAVGLADWLLLAAQDMRVATDGRSVALLLGVCGLAVVMQRRNPAASRLAVAGAQVIVFTHVGA